MELQSFAFSFRDKIVSYNALHDKSDCLYVVTTERTIEIFDTISISNFHINIDNPHDYITALCIETIYIYFSTISGKLCGYQIFKGTTERIFYKEINSYISSMTCECGKLIYISENQLYSIDINLSFPTSPSLLREYVSHKNCSLSPFKMALALYTIGKGNPLIWFLPFDECEVDSLKMKGELISFSWVDTQILSAVTASTDSNIRLWSESQFGKELVCTAVIYMESPIKCVEVCHPSHNLNKQNRIESLSSKSGKVFPLYQRQKVTVIATLDQQEDNTLFLENKRGYGFDIIKKLTMKNDFDFGATTMNKLLHNNMVKTKFDMIRISKKGMDLFSVVFGRDCDVRKVISIPFIHKPIDKIMKNDDIITKNEDGSFTNWSAGAIEEGQPGNIFGDLVMSSKGIIKEEKMYPYPFQITGYEIERFGKTTMGVIYGDSNCSVFFNNPSQLLEVEVHHKIKSVSIYSTDLFVINTTNSIMVFFFDDKQFICIDSLKGENMTSTFIRYCIPILAVSSNNSISLVEIKDASLVWTGISIQSLPYSSLVLRSDGSLIASTPNTIDRIFIDYNDSKLPKQYPEISDYVLFTALCLGLIPVVYEIANGNEPTIDTYLKNVDISSFNFSNCPHPIVKKVFNYLPNDWFTLDLCSLRFILPFLLMKVLNFHTKLFHVWALFSPQPLKLFKYMAVNTIDDLRNSLVVLWSKDRETLQECLSFFLAQNIPKDSKTELDLYVLLAIACGKKAFAAKALSLNGNDTLANFILNAKGEKASKIALKNAYGALKMHRSYLAAMFFIIRGDILDGINCLKDDNIMMLTVSRLLDDSHWQQQLEEKIGNELNGFFIKYFRNDIVGAAEALKDAQLEHCDFLSLEAIRIEILQKLNISYRKGLLSLVKMPLLFKTVLEHSTKFVQGTFCNSDVVEEIIENTETSDGDSEYDNQGLEFDFGTNIDDTWSDYYDSDSESSSEDTNFKIGYVYNAPKEFDLNPKQFESSFFDVLNTKTPTDYIPLEETDADIGRLLSQFLVTKSENDSKKLIKIASNLPESTCVPVVCCVAVVNGYPPIINFLSEDGLKAFPEIALDDPKILHNNQLNLIDGLSNDDVIFLEYILLSIVMRFTAKLFPESNSVVYLAISGFLDSTLQTMRRPFFSSKSILSLVKNLSESIEDELNSFQKAYEAEAFSIASDDETMCPFISGRSIHREGFIKTPPGIEDIAICRSTDEKLFVLINGFVSTLALNTKVPSELEEFNRPLIPKDCEPNSNLSLFRNSSYIRNVSQHVGWGARIHENANTCIDAHPTRPAFVSGGQTGLVHLWMPSEEKEYCVVNSAQFSLSSSPVSSVFYNSVGSRIGCVCQNGELVISDFTGIQTVTRDCLGADWLNNDTQLVSISADGLRLHVFDTLAGDDPVLGFDLPRRGRCLCSMLGSVGVGFEDGYIGVVDVRAEHQSRPIEVHGSAVHKIRADPTASFMASSGEDGVGIVSGSSWSTIELIGVPWLVPCCISVNRRECVAASSEGVHVWYRNGVCTK